MPIRLVWPTVASEVKLQGTSVRQVRKTVLGAEIELELATPTTFSVVNEVTESVAVAFGAVRVRLRQSDEGAHRVLMAIDFKRSVGTVRLPDFHHPVGLPLDALRAFALGIDDDGNPVSGKFYGRHILIGGIPGSGKSNALRVFLSHLSASRSVALYGIDPKRVELALWRKRFSNLVLGNDAAETIALLEELHVEINRRTEHLSQNDLVSIEPSQEFPWVVLIVDEWAELAAGGNSKERAKADELLRRYVSLGRAVGCTAILCTQRPTNDVIDVGTRSLLNDRFALRCGDRYQAEAILSAGTFQQSDLIGATVGRALWSDGGPGRPLQFFQVCDLDVARLSCPGYKP